MRTYLKREKWRKPNFHNLNHLSSKKSIRFVIRMLWRNLNPDKQSFTWITKSFKIQGRLDYFLVLQELICRCNFTDFSGPTSALTCKPVTTTLSISQRRGIISLIPKKNKDNTILESLRPISLLNVDYKILTKVIAKRIENVLPTLINSDQRLKDATLAFFKIIFYTM